jgi:hypothetical protein
MADFPTLEAEARSYPLPRRPASSVAQRTGSRAEFSHDPTGLTTEFELEFPNARSTDLDLVKAHFRGQQQHTPFQIPLSLWRNHAAIDDLIPAWDRGSPTFYTYLEPPTHELTAGGLYNIRVRLRVGF